MRLPVFMLSEPSSRKHLPNIHKLKTFFFFSFFIVCNSLYVISILFYKKCCRRLWAVFSKGALGKWDAELLLTEWSHWWHPDLCLSWTYSETTSLYTSCFQIKTHSLIQNCGTPFVIATVWIILFESTEPSLPVDTHDFVKLLWLRSLPVPLFVSEGPLLSECFNTHIATNSITKKSVKKAEAFEGYWSGGSRACL